jgi:teichuronic acid biosynthesis glycosyltransferase TuaC
MIDLKNKNLLIISHNTAPFVIEQVKELAKYFNMIYVICPKNILNKKYCIEGNIDIYFTKYFYLPFLHSQDNKRKNMLNSVLKCIAKNKLEFDLIHSHFILPDGYIGGVIANMRKVPHVITSHENSNWLYKQLEKSLCQDVIKKANLIIRVNKRDVPKIKKYNKNVKTIVNGFNYNNFNKNRLNKYNKKKVIINIANYKIEHKNQINLLKAIKMLKEKRNDFILYLVGKDAGDRKTIEKYIKQNNLKDNVIVLGEKKHKVIPDMLSVCDLMVLPSYSEGNPTVMFESLGSGTPFIGTDVGDVKNIINDDCGLVIDDPDNFNAIFNAIDYAIDEKWDSEKIKKYSKKYTWENIVKQIIKDYKKVLK